MSTTSAGALLSDKSREQAESGLPAIVLRQRRDILPELRNGLCGRIVQLPHFRRACLGTNAEVGDNGIRPDVKARFVLARHPEQLADHRHRERIGEVIDEVDPCLAT